MDNNCILICPVCGKRLVRLDNTYRCENRHSYDISRKGYVNLIMSQKSSKKRHGDDKLMIAARRSFLRKQYYRPIADAAVSVIKKSGTIMNTAVDIGCGEGYYTALLHEAFPECSFYGIDISKDALNYAAAADKTLTLAAASAAALPIESCCADCAVNIFAPIFPNGVKRILKPNGILIRAVPLEDHLYGLKKAIYKKAYKNPSEEWLLEGLNIADTYDVEYNITLSDHKDIEDLFMMTPYYYKTSREDQQRLSAVSELQTEIRVRIIAYKAI